LTLAQADVFLAPRPSDELYYTPDDSNQLRNLADDPNHEDVRKRLSTLLDQWIEETGDAIPDSLTQDAFDRETGTSLGGTKRNSTPGDFPGKQRNAALINAPGPK
jgi:hypothetical protein